MSVVLEILNPEYQFISVDINLMKPGTFYIPYINKDQATALIEAPPFNIPFTNMKYLKHQLTTSHSIEIWEIRRYEDKEAHINITNAVSWHIEQPDNNLVIFSNLAIDGYIKFI